MPAEPDDPQKQLAVRRLQLLAGTHAEDVAGLVDAIVRASRDQVLEMITGSGAVPSNMVASRAELLYFACVHANRILTQREVEVLFRTLPASARAILASMHATYEEALREQFLTRMRSGARVASAGTDATKLRWVITFSDASNLQIAWEEIQRLGFSEDAVLNSYAKSINIPRKVTVADDEIDTLSELGLASHSGSVGGRRSPSR